MYCLVAALLLLKSTEAILNESNVHSKDFIQTINEIQNTWKAGSNFHPGSYVKNMISFLPMKEEKLPVRQWPVRNSLPENFDARKNWKRCNTVRRVYDQGNCASAWALVAAGVFTDRLCVSKVESVEVSAQNVLACCQACGTNCYGGYVTDALNFLAKRGAPTNRCHPYEIHRCPKLLGVLNCPAVRTLSPRCRVKCRLAYKKKPNQDLRHAGQAYSVANLTIAIMSEILLRGPVVAVMDLYEDLFVYKGGIYTRTAGRLLGHHPVKVIGWGNKEGRSYWLVVNTWSQTWGDKGVLKIARETNGCNLENRVFAVTPNK